jgi:tetratricopeptide (TPR) repeat protein
VTRQTNAQIYAEYDTMLAALSPEKNPVEWGSLHINYGNAYLTQGTTNVSQYRKNLEHAQEHYGEALRVFSYEQQPLLWAQVQVNLGMVTRQLLHDSLGKIASAEAGYNEALHVGMRNVLAGLAQRQQNLLAAISHFDSALTVLSYETTPREWALAHRERAMTYYLLADPLSVSGSKASEQKQYIVRAQADLAEALKVFTRENEPMDWANLHHNRALMYMAAVTKDLKTDAAHALADCSAALEVYTPEIMPAAYRRVQVLRAFMLERLERWTDVHEALVKAREAQRDLVAAPTSEQGSLEAISDNAFMDIYLRDAQTLLHIKPHRLEEVVVALE